ncbi:MAG: hypothetical protein HYT22_00825 [Candidatus Niyogibacteria bacterium]|nr:hypothetical protein [Candidatus Niyogibacteria bacterium]
MPTPTEIQQRFQRLPQELKDAIFSMDTAEAIRMIGKKHRLAVDKIGVLADETGYFMLGFTKPEHFIGKLQRNLGVSEEISKGITEDLNVRIFSKIRASLRRVHTMEEDHVIPVPPPVSRPPAAELPKGSPLSAPKDYPLGQPAPAPMPSPFESKLQEKVFSAQKELSEAREQKTYPGNKDPYREPIS